MTDDRIGPDHVGPDVRDPDVLDPDVLDTFAVPEPSADLGDRVLAAVAVQRAAATVRRRRFRVLALGAAVAAAAVAVVIASGAFGARDHQLASGSAAPSARTTAQLGDRGVAVVEPGAQLSWRVERDGSARIDQRAGDVFYRVERGGAFVVETPAGDVTVRGTCFRVELEQLAIRGAPPATPTVIVTVYEGKVELANRLGRVAITAGERAAATPEAAPRGTASPAASPAPIAEISVAELVARERAHREREAALEARLAQLTAAGSVQAIGLPQPVTRPFEMSRPELVELARQCRAPLDVPPTAGSTMMDQIVEDGMRATAFDAAERAATQRVIARFQVDYEAELAAMYRELTGEDSSLDPMSLIIELIQKSLPADVATAHQLISAERAGLRPPPTSDAKLASIVERYLRFAIAAADRFERQLAAEIGASRARAFRRTWGMVDINPRCPREATP